MDAQLLGGGTMAEGAFALKAIKVRSTKKPEVQVVMESSTSSFKYWLPLEGRDI